MSMYVYVDYVGYVGLVAHLRCDFSSYQQLLATIVAWDDSCMGLWTTKFVQCGFLRSVRGQKHQKAPFKNIQDMQDLAGKKGYFYAC